MKEKIFKVRITTTKAKPRSKRLRALKEKEANEQQGKNKHEC